MRTKFTLLLAMLLFVTSMGDTTFAGKIIYVDTDAKGGNNGQQAGNDQGAAEGRQRTVSFGKVPGHLNDVYHLPIG